MKLLDTHFSARSSILTAIAEHDGSYSVFQTQHADVLGVRPCSCRKHAEEVFLRWVTGCSVLTANYAQGMAPRLGFSPLALLRAATYDNQVRLEDVRQWVDHCEQRS